MRKRAIIAAEAIMRLKILTIIITVLLTSVGIFPAAPPAGAVDPPTAPVSELEDELTAIEKELTGLEKEIDVLLEDLLDPKVTSLSVFFTSLNIRGHVPVSIQIKMDGTLLTSREFSETDRLVLVRGGAIEVFSGIGDPVTQSLAVECFLSSNGPQNGITATSKAAFKFEAVRARANFIEITLSEDLTNKEPTYKLSARHWSKEP